MANNITDEVLWSMCEQETARLSTVEIENSYNADRPVPPMTLRKWSQPTWRVGSWNGETLRRTDRPTTSPSLWLVQLGGTLQTSACGSVSTSLTMSVDLVIIRYDYDVPSSEFGFPHRVKSSLGTGRSFVAESDSYRNFDVARRATTTIINTILWWSIHINIHMSCYFLCVWLVLSVNTSMYLSGLFLATLFGNFEK